MPWNGFTDFSDPVAFWRPINRSEWSTLEIIAEDYRRSTV